MGTHTTPGAAGNAGGAEEQARLAALYQLEILDTPREEPFDDIVAVAAAICDTPIAIINFVDADRQWGKALVGLESSEAPRAASFCAQTIESNDGMLVVPDTLADPRWADNPQVVGEPGLRFYAGAAVRTGDGHALGTLCVADTTGPRDLDARARAALTALARQTAALLAMREQAIKLSAAYRQLRSLAITDPLTQLVNRTFMEHSLWLALRGRERSGRPLGILFCDLDGLKQVNDRDGHAAGDHLLRVVGERLSETGRGSDLVCRFGGDEFVVMCPDLQTEEDLAIIAQRLDERVAGPVVLEGQRLELRLSIGRALARDGDDAATLLGRADEDMYRAKRDRR
jgi:diguanylate cyclase (GGDEF)-like protein